MTTNKPEVMAWYTPATRYTLPVVALDDRSQRGEPLIRLSDYEALQADYEKLRKHLQNLIDQTTPLVPEPDNPMWSRRIQLDEVMAECDSLRAECEKLRKDAERYRWLRKECQKHTGLTIAKCDEWGMEGWSGDDPDAAIDAVMKRASHDNQ